MSPTNVVLNVGAWSYRSHREINIFLMIKDPDPLKWTLEWSAVINKWVDEESRTADWIESMPDNHFLNSSNRMPATLDNIYSLLVQFKELSDSIVT